MTRHPTSSLVAFSLAVSLFAGTAFAGTQYRAEPAASPAASKMIVKGIVWKCGDGACVAPQGNSRPTIDCPALARQVGALRSFSVGGQPIDSAALGKCNAKAR